MKDIKDISPTLEMIEGVPIEVRGRVERSECLLSILDADTLTSEKTHKRLSVVPAGGGKAETRDMKVLKLLIERIGKKEGFIPYAGIFNSRSKEMRDRFPKAVESNGHHYEVSFVVVHFGNDVPYCVEGFCERNADQLDLNLKELLQECATKNASNAFMHSIFNQEAAKERSIAFKFREEMAKLVDRQLRTCNGHFIRCIKPNNERKPFLLDPNTCTPQLQSCGVKEAAVVAQAGFDKSYKAHDLVSILVKGMIATATFERLGEEAKGKLALYYLRKVFHQTGHEDYAIGKTKIFFRPGVWEQCMARQIDYETLADAVLKQRKRRAMEKKMQQLRADLHEYVVRNRTRRMSVVHNEEQRLAVAIQEEEVEQRLKAAVGKAMAEAEMAHQEELERERQKMAEAFAAERERERVAAQAKLAEQMEAALVATKAKEVKMQLDLAEATRHTQELSEYKTEAEYLREELRKYKTEAAVLRGLLQQVKERTQAYIQEKGKALPNGAPSTNLPSTVLPEGPSTDASLTASAPSPDAPAPSPSAPTLPPTPLRRVSGTRGTSSIPSPSLPPPRETSTSVDSLLEDYTVEAP